MKITISNKLFLSNIPRDLHTAICERLTMQNLKWHENERMGRYNGKTAKLLRFYEQTKDGDLVLPRGFIRQLIHHRHGSEIADNVRILYGGSVTSENIAELMKKPEIDGALVGGASLKADDFLSITRQTSEIWGLA